MSLEDHKKAAETKFSVDQQTLFKIEARASKLIGLWAGSKMGLTGTELETYAKEVVVTNLDEPGYDDVKRKLISDFSDGSIEVSEAEIDHIIAKCVADATLQIQNELKA